VIGRFDIVASEGDARAGVLHTANGELAARRQHQSLAWMWERIEAGLKHDFHEHEAVRALLAQLTKDVEAGRMPASTAARRLLDAWHKD